MTLEARTLRCQAMAVEDRCKWAAHHFRDGFAVCRQHATNQKFKPWPTVEAIHPDDFCEFDGRFAKNRVANGRWPKASADVVAHKRAMRAARERMERALEQPEDDT